MSCDSATKPRANRASQRDFVSCVAPEFHVCSAENDADTTEFAAKKDVSRVRGRPASETRSSTARPAASAPHAN